MAIEIPACNDSQRDLLRKILLSLPDISGAGPTLIAGNNITLTPGSGSITIARSPLSVSDGLFWIIDLSGGPIANFVQSGYSSGLEFPVGVPSSIVTNFILPIETSLTVNPVLRCSYFVSTNGLGNGDIRLRLNCKYLASGDLATAANDEILLQTIPIIDTLDLTGDFSFTLNSALISTNDVISFQLERLWGDPADTFAGSIAVIFESRFNFTMI